MVLYQCTDRWAALAQRELAVVMTKILGFNYFIGNVKTINNQKLFVTIVVVILLNFA